MTAVFGALGIGPRTTVVAYDDLSGMFAARLWWMLRYLGHRDAALLDGGLQSWRRAGGALESGEAPRTPAAFAARPQERMRVDLEAVETSLEKGELLLLDAREAFRWRGEREPIDPVAGRIPGARNHPWQRNLAEDGRFLDPRAAPGAVRPGRGGEPGPPDRLLPAVPASPRAHKRARAEPGGDRTPPRSMSDPGRNGPPIRRGRSSADEAGSSGRGRGGASPTASCRKPACLSPAP